MLRVSLRRFSVQQNKYYKCVLATCMVVAAAFPFASGAQETETSIAQASTTQTSNSQSANQNTMPIRSANNADESQRGAFGVTYFLIGGQSLGENTSNFDVFDSYLSFNYKANQNLRFAARPSFGYSVAGTNKFGDEVNDRSRVRDFSFVMTMYNVAEDYLPAELSYKIQPRLYLPTSDDSKEQGLIAKLRFEQELKWRFQKYSDIRVYLVPNYYFQRNTTYLSNSNPKKPNSLKTTSMVDSEHGIELNYSMNKMFSIKPGLNFVERWSNSSAENNLTEFRSSVIDYRLGLEVRATREISFTLGLQQEQDLIRTDKSPEMSYSILTGGTLF